jgi:hypothetical protein
MNRNYTKYTADQLLNDEYFIASELHPTPPDKNFWLELEKKDMILAGEIKIARVLLRSIKSGTDKENLSQEAEDELWKRISIKNNKYDTRLRRSIKVGLSIAASVSLLIGIVWYSKQAKNEIENDYLSMLENIRQTNIQSNDVQLILSNEENIMIDGKETSIEYNEDGSVKINSEEEIRAEEKVNKAANASSVKAFNQLIVPVGKRSKITFRDGTNLWINSGSKVIYPESFDGEKREIFVEGEVFLDVARDPAKPFIVKTRQLDVTVLGTQFNVSAYETDERMQVVLVEGKVEIQTQEKRKHELSPNELFSFNTSTHENKITHVDVNDYIAWKDGYYQFQKQKMNIVLRKISEFYGVNITWSEQLKDLSCSGKLDLKEDINEVFNSLKKAAPIKIIKTEENVYIDVEPLN